MDTGFDTKTQHQIQEFHRDLSEMEMRYKKAILLLAKDRMIRDLEMMSEPPRPRRSHLSIRLLGYIGNQVRQRLLRRQRSETGESDDVQLHVIVIDPSDVLPAKHAQSRPDETQNQERRFFDG